MRKRILALAMAVMATAGLSIAIPGTANASPGHVTLNCNTYNSTGWHNVSYDGLVRGSVCMTIHSDGDHEDVTYWAYDARVDGITIRGDRNLSWEDDGWVNVTNTTGGGSTVHNNKQYAIGSSQRWVQYRGWTDPGYTTVYTEKLYW